MLTVSTAKVQLLQDLTGAKWEKKLHISVDQKGVSVSNFSSTTNITDTVISRVIILP